MSASRLSVAAVAAAAAAVSTCQNRAYADSSFRFNPFSSSPSKQKQQQEADQTANQKSDAKSEPEEPKGAGFDPEALERGAKALREINSSPHAKQVLIFIQFQISIHCF